MPSLSIPWRSVLLAAWLAVSLAPAHALSIDVDRTDDVNASGCGASVPNDCSLRGALIRAAASSEAVTISLPAGTYPLNTPTVCNYREQGNVNLLTPRWISLCINTAVTLEGAGADRTVILGNSTERVLRVGMDANVTVSGVTLRNGNGGVDNQGTLRLEDVVITQNTASTGAGGIYNAGILDLRRVTVQGNNAIANVGDGGGIYNAASRFSSSGQPLNGSLTIVDSVVANNAAGNNGGGIVNAYGIVAMTGSTVSGNAANQAGGGLANSGVVTLTNVTVSGNRSDSSGGGIANGDGVGRGTVMLNNVSIVANRALARGSGGGVSNNGRLALRNTLLAGNFDPGPLQVDCHTSFGGPLVSEGHNLIQNPGVCRIAGDTTGNVIGRDPQIDPLADNGGLTRTHLPRAGSPVVDAGSAADPGSGGTACAATDQRGSVRPRGSRCDIGAVERIGVFSVSGVSPRKAANAGPLVVLMSGEGLADGAALRLRRTGHADVPAAPATVNAAGTLLTTTIELSGRAAGTWDVVVANPDGTEATLAGAFQVEDTRAATVWVDLVGRVVTRPGRSVRLVVSIGNRGNVDAVAMPLLLSLPGAGDANRYFSISPPPAQAGQVAATWSPTSVALAPLGTGSAGSGSVDIPLLLPLVPAGMSGSLELTLNLPTTAQEGDQFFLSARLGAPYFDPDLKADTVAGLVAGAKAYAARVLQVSIPATRDPALAAYIGTQLQSLVAAGRTEWVVAQGARVPVYSLPQLVIDAASFGAAGTPVASEPGALARSAPHAGSTAGPTRMPKAASGPCGLGNSCPKDGEIVLAKAEALPSREEIEKQGFIRTGAQCRELHNHHPSADGTTCIPISLKGCGIIQQIFFSDPDCLRIPIRIVVSIDPNDKAGPPGATAQQFVPEGTPLHYTIFFENLPTASAPAQEVLITDRLDPAKVDLASFRLGSMSFGDVTVLLPPGLGEYHGAVDLGEGRDLIVRLDAGLDQRTGIATWRFSTVDAVTSQLTDDPLAGFLPANVDAPEGEGRVAFSVLPLPGLATGTAIPNQASITFDLNAPIATPVWLNTIDATKPQSAVSPLPATVGTTTFDVRWSGTDAGAGIADYSVFVSADGGPYTTLVSNTAATSASFTGQAGSSYRFYSVARDRVGNTEDSPQVPDAATGIAAVACAVDVTAQVGITRGGYRRNPATGRYVQQVTLRNIGASAVQGPLVLVFDGLSANAGLYGKSGDTNCATPVGPYQDVGVGTDNVLSVGERAAIVVEFANPGNQSINYTPRVLSGVPR